MKQKRRGRKETRKTSSSERKRLRCGLSYADEEKKHKQKWSEKGNWRPVKKDRRRPQKERNTTLDTRSLEWLGWLSHSHDWTQSNVMRQASDQLACRTEARKQPLTAWTKIHHGFSLTSNWALEMDKEKKMRN